MGLPMAFGAGAEVARDKIQAIVRVLKHEIPAFASFVFQEQKFKAAKILVSGEGSRVPGLVNALDASLSAPVEVINLSPRVSTAPEDEDFPEDRVALSMGKAIGLAAGALETERPACALAGPVARRNLFKEIPLLTYLAGLILLMVAGMAGLESARSGRLKALQQNLAAEEPSSAGDAMEAQRERIDRLQARVRHLQAAHRARSLFPRLGELFNRFEAKSSRGTFGDFHLKSITVDYESSNTMEATVATRRAGEEETRNELSRLFEPFLEDLRLEGPTSAQEETPPPGLGPLVLYKVEGRMR
jgi:hypothetical protein